MPLPFDLSGEPVPLPLLLLLLLRRSLSFLFLREDFLLRLLLLLPPPSFSAAELSLLNAGRGCVLGSFFCASVYFFIFWGGGQGRAIEEKPCWGLRGWDFSRQLCRC